MKKNYPAIEWEDGEYSVTLPLDDGSLIEASWRPTVTTVVRIRKKGARKWSPGFETPLNGCSFTDLEPDTEYEVKIAHKNKNGEGEAKYMTVRTSAGSEGV